MVESEIVEQSEKTEAPHKAQGGDARQTYISPPVLSGIVRAADVLIVAASAVAVAELYLGLVVDQPVSFERYLFIGLTGGLLFEMLFRTGDGYSLKMLSSLKWQLRHAVLALGSASSILLGAAFLLKASSDFSRVWALAWATMAIGALASFRVLLHSAIQHWSKLGYLTRNVAIVGAGEITEAVIEKLERAEDQSVAIVGIFDDRRTRVPSEIKGYAVRGTTDDLVALARTSRIDDVILALPGNAVERLGFLLRKLKRLPADLKVSADWMTSAFPVKGISNVGPAVLLDVFDRPLKNWNGVLKWFEDKILGAILLLIAAPIMALIAIAIRLDSPGPIFFVQDRFGFNNNIIRVFKFRTMHAGSGDPSGSERTVLDDPRVTRVGRILRRLSLDELPQLVNVVRGEMSLVGPRPHAIAMKAGGLLYNEAVSDYLHRHRVKPGVTGWAQVHGLRGEIDTIEKARARVEHDLYYIDNWSLWLDLETLLMTLRIVLSRENAY